MPWGPAAALLAASFAAGLTNALAGGGSLLTFPVLLAIGLPPVTANVTNTVALAPGYLGAVLGQARDLGPASGHLRRLLPAAGVGGAIGALLLLHSSERFFLALVPWLILLGSALLGLQPWLKQWLGTLKETQQAQPLRMAMPAILLAAVYGGYFGAGLSVIVLALLALTLGESLTRLNALKQAIALIANLTAAAIFLGSTSVAWGAAGLMVAGSLLGGAAGGRLASRVNPDLLRWLVVLVGLAIGLVYLLR